MPAESNVYVTAMFEVAITYVFFMHGIPLLRSRVCDSIPFESEFLLAPAWPIAQSKSNVWDFWG